jgi:hypothetical protein
MSTLLLALFSAATASSSLTLAEGEPLALDEELARVRIPWSDDSGKGFGLAYDNGSWGNQWMQGLRLKIAFHDHFGANLRGIALFGSAPSFGDRIDLGGRLEFYGCSPVFLNFVRLYGGGGLSVLSPVHGVADAKVAIGGGGYFGFEVFQLPWMSWILEVGGNSGSQDSFGAGATITAGIQFYPF